MGTILTQLFQESSNAGQTLSRAKKTAAPRPPHDKVIISFKPRYSARMSKGQGLYSISKENPCPWQLVIAELIFFYIRNSQFSGHTKGFSGNC